MRILVCGGRDYTDVDTLNDFLDRYIHEISILISGMARGADTLAAFWAHDNLVPVDEYPADWDRYGKRAGYIRNKQMLDYGKPDLVIAFPGGKGTKMMKRLASEYGVEVIEVG